MVSNQLCESNYAAISGKIASEPVFSHEIYGEGFYFFFVNVKRLSDSFDKIPVMISDRLVSPEECTIGKIIYVEGQFRSYNNIIDNHSKLMLMVFAREVWFDSDAATKVTTNIDDDESRMDKNMIILNGYICKDPVYRITPLNREIADLLLAVNRSYNKSDYIPCISWGRNAKYSASRRVGDNVRIKGRIQSRTYQKRLPDGTTEERVAYEVSVVRLELLQSAEQSGVTFGNYGKRTRQESGEITPSYVPPKPATEQSDDTVI